MTRRQAKLAKRAAERAALERDPRPFGGFASEADLIAMQEFAPSARAKIAVKGVDYPVYLVTVLPGATAAIVRDTDGDTPPTAFVALQRQHRGPNPHKDLAHTLAWLQTAQPGQTLGTSIADGTEPELSELMDPAQKLDVQVEKDFDWWLPEGQTIDPAMQQNMKQVNESMLPTERVDVSAPGAVWWTDGGDKGYIRWIRQDDEDALFTALARLYAAGDLTLGEGTRFAGAFRTHGVAVPVFDVDPTVTAQEFQEPIQELAVSLEKALAVDTPLTADERKARDTIRSRQVTNR